MRHSFLDKYSNLDSPLHRMNPRFKLMGTLGFILLSLVLPIRYLFPIFFLIPISKVPVSHFLKRLLIISPFILLGIISGGWIAVIRAGFCVIVLTLLSSTTRFSDLLKGLQGLGCPKLVVMIMSFMYRYIFVLADELMRMKQAYDARTIGFKRWFHIKTLSNLLGLLFIRSYERAERVYIAMCSRGFSGEVR